MPYSYKSSATLALPPFACVYYYWITTIPTFDKPTITGQRAFTSRPICSGVGAVFYVSRASVLALSSFQFTFSCSFFIILITTPTAIIRTSARTCPRRIVGVFGAVVLKIVIVRTVMSICYPFAASVVLVIVYATRAGVRITILGFCCLGLRKCWAFFPAVLRFSGHYPCSSLGICSSSSATALATSSSNSCPTSPIAYLAIYSTPTIIRTILSVGWFSTRVTISARTSYISGLFSISASVITSSPSAFNPCSRVDGRYRRTVFRVSSRATIMNTRSINIASVVSDITRAIWETSMDRWCSFWLPNTTDLWRVWYSGYNFRQNSLRSLFRTY